MRFRLVETGKSYAEPEKTAPTTEDEGTADDRVAPIPPIIFGTGNMAQIRSLLVLREAELILAKAQLTGKAYVDWFTHNRIRDLEIKIADLKRWLAEAAEN